MPIKINVNNSAKDVVDAKVCVNGVAKQVEQIWTNVNGVAKLVWENWAYKVGNFFSMTSNNWNGFVASKMQGGGTIYFEAGEPYLAFDNNAGTSRNATINITNAYFGCHIEFARSIKIRKINFSASITTTDRNRTFIVKAWNLNTSSWETLYSVNGSGGGGTNSGTITWGSDALYSAIEIYYQIGSGGAGADIKIYGCQVTEWIQKGQ